MQLVRKWKIMVNGSYIFSIAEDHYANVLRMLAILDFGSSDKIDKIEIELETK